jgi:hypothetical protein
LEALDSLHLSEKAARDSQDSAGKLLGRNGTETKATRMIEAHLTRHWQRMIPPAVERPCFPEHTKSLARDALLDIATRTYGAGRAGACSGSSRGALIGTVVASAGALVIALLRGMIPDLATTIAVGAMNVVVFALIGVTLGFALGGAIGAIVAGVGEARQAWQEHVDASLPTRRHSPKHCTEHNGNE